MDHDSMRGDVHPEARMVSDLVQPATSLFWGT